MAKQILLLLACFAFLIHTSAQVQVNEILSSNSNSISDPDYNNYSDWVELYNTSDTDITLNGYFLSDNGSKIEKWAFPETAVIKAKSFYTVWADGKDSANHTNFKLSSNGESIYLSKEGIIIDSVLLRYQTADISYGRKTDGSNEFVLFQNPTYNTSNNQSTNYIPLAPEFSQPAGFYSGNISLSLNNPSGIGDIYYTTNNENPITNGTKYSTPITITTTTVVRAVIKNEHGTSRLISSTYFINQRSFNNLPIVSVSAPDDDLYSDERGIFVEGYNADPEDPHYGANYWNDIEIPASIELFDEQGTQVVDVYAGIKVFGGWSRMNAQKSISVNCREIYGGNKINYKIFKDKNIDEFKNIVLRNSGNDFPESMMRDGTIQEIMKRGMLFDFQGFQPAVVFVNGKYHGIMNIREKINEHYTAQNYGCDPDNVDVLERNGNVISGKNDDYVKLLQYMEQNNMAGDLQYAYVKSQIDIPAYIDYMIAEIHTGNGDWPGNNIKYWKDRNGGKWRFILFDTDQGYGIWNRNVYQNNLEDALAPNSTNWYNPPWATFLFRKLMENPQFKQDFTQRFMFHLETTLNAAESEKIIDSVNALTSAELPYHEQRWYKINRTTDIQRMKNWAYERPYAIMDHLQETLGMSRIGTLTINVKEGMGTFKVNEFEYDYTFSSQTFADNTISIKPNPKNGYSFSHWSLSNSESSAVNAIKTKDLWKYKEQQAETAWNQVDFDDSQWNEGNALLGYGDNDIATQIDFGGNENEKYPAYYFRKEFTITDPSSIEEIQCAVLCDDGAVVYINGNEIQRINMPQNEEITHETLASASGDESTYNQVSIPLSNLQAGKNILAIEVHQVTRESSDLRFDARISVLYNGNNNATIRYDEIPDTIFSGDNNINIYFKRESNLKIAEIYYGTEGNQYIEIVNTGQYTVDLTNGSIEGAISLPQLGNVKINPQERIVFCADSAAFPSIKAFSWESGKLTNQGTIKIIAADGFIEDSITYSNALPWPETSNAIELKNQQLDNSLGSNWQASAQNQGTPGGETYASAIPSLHINEAMPYNIKSIIDEYGEIEDWIEIYNPNSQPIDIGGLYISDTRNNLGKYKFSANNPSETTIPANGYLLVWLDNDPKQGILHTNFALNRKGETIYLSAINWKDTIIIDQLTYNTIAADVAIARLPDGSNNTDNVFNYTPEKTNKKIELASGIYINEVMANNTDAVAYNNEYLQWIEIYNDNNEDFDLANYYLSTNKENYTLWQFPSNNAAFTTVPAKGYKTFYLKSNNNEGFVEISLTGYIPLKIDPKNIELFLSQKVKENAVLVDQFIWYFSTENQSAARIPDGSTHISNLSPSTPNAPNGDHSNIAETIKEDVLIGPTPAKNYVNIINNTDNTIHSITISNSQGQMLSETKNSEINISQYASGILYFKIVTSENTFYKKIIKQ